MEGKKFFGGDIFSGGDTFLGVESFFDGDTIFREDNFFRVGDTFVQNSICHNQVHNEIFIEMPYRPNAFIKLHRCRLIGQKLNLNGVEKALYSREKYFSGE